MLDGGQTEEEVVGPGEFGHHQVGRLPGDLSQPLETIVDYESATYF